MWTRHFPNGEEELEGLYRRPEKTPWRMDGVKVEERRRVKSIFSYRMGTPERGRCSLLEYENGPKASEREFLEGHLATA